MEDTLPKARLAYAVLLGTALLQSIYFYPRLPETISAHYNTQGVADGWSAKGPFFVFYALLLGLMLALFTLIPRLIQRLPNALINLPNKDYWLAPARRDQTLAVFASQLRWFGVAVIAVLVGVFQLALSANLPGSAGFPTTVALLVLGAFLLFTVAWTIRMLLTWRIPRA
jgi:uncharacterized membrane protein